MRVQPGPAGMIERQREILPGNFIYVNWDGINPDNKDAINKPIDCVDMFYDGRWNDRPCYFQASFICER